MSSGQMQRSDVDGCDCITDTFSVVSDYGEVSGHGVIPMPQL